MIKTLIMVECDYCYSVMPGVITLTNRSDLPGELIYGLLLDAEERGWQSHHASSDHMCDDCCDPDHDYNTKKPPLLPF